MVEIGSSEKESRLTMRAATVLKVKAVAGF
jgi:hypothetical protein